MTTLGEHGPEVSRVGLGCMGMSGMYGPAEREESIATIHAALDAGINLLDTGDFYGMGHNEMLVGEALSTRKSDEDIAKIEQAMPAEAAVGDRYPQAQMAQLDSER